MPLTGKYFVAWIEHGRQAIDLGDHPVQPQLDAGLDAGVQVRLNGMVTQLDGLPAMFNPRYEILSRQEHL